MITKEYKIAYSEVLEILKYISSEEYNKIPIDMLEMFKDNAEKNNDFEYNPDKTLKEQEISETARALIAVLFRDYWATEEQREKIIRVQQQERIRIENEKQEKYKSEDIFKNNNKVLEKEEVALIKVKEQKWYKKVLDFFRKIFKKEIF